MKTIPNYITLSRIFLSLALVFVKPLGLGFYILYTACGLSDFIDGYIARRMGISSSLGAKLDSLADFVMIFVLLFILYPIVRPTTAVFVWIAFICFIRFLSMFIALIKFKTPAILHTYGNKITGIGLFLFAMLLPIINPKMLIYIICAIASISAVEEMVIQLTSQNLDLNRKTVFIK